MRMVDNMHVFGNNKAHKERKKSGITYNKMSALGAPLKGYK